MCGVADKDPSYLLQKKIVFVSVAYRLGPLGFLSTEDDIVPGNNGLKDQNMALKWIQKNIESFGGNPNSVTISGVSAGGASVTYHILSPLSRNLFQRAYAVSGSALNPWAQAEYSLGKAQRLAESVNCTTIDTERMVNCMKSVPGKELLKNIKLFQEVLYNPFSPFGPVVEKGGRNPFLPDSPINLLNKNQVYDVPLILSMTVDEGLYPTAEFLSNRTFLLEVETHWIKYAPAILDYMYTVPISEQNKVSRAIIKYYSHSDIVLDKNLSNNAQIDRPLPLTESNIRNNERLLFDEMTQAIGDRLFKSTIEKTVKLMALVKVSPTYFINFGYRGEFNALSILSKSNESLGASHGAEVIFYFNNDKFPLKESDQKMQNLLLNMVWDYMKNGQAKIGEKYLRTVSKVDYLEYLDIKNPDDIQKKTAVTLSNSGFWSSLPFYENILTVTRGGVFRRFS